MTTTPMMSAEAGYGIDEAQTPFRISGLITLVLGLLSPFAILGLPVLIIPISGIAFGFFALRSYEGPKPVGLRAGMIGLTLAVGFGACGLFMPWFKTVTLGKQAEYFARQYLALVAKGEMEMAMELRKTYNNRFLHTMSLKQHYEEVAKKQEEMRVALDTGDEPGEISPNSFEEFTSDGVNRTIQTFGTDAEWRLDRPTRIFHKFGKDRAEVYLSADNGGRDYLLIIEMIYQIHPKTGVGQWNIERCAQYAEQIYAESIL